MNPLKAVPVPPLENFMGQPLDPESPHPYAIAEVNGFSHAVLRVFSCFVCFVVFVHRSCVCSVCRWEEAGGGRMGG